MLAIFLLYKNCGYDSPGQCVVTGKMPSYCPAYQGLAYEFPDLTYLGIVIIIIIKMITIIMMS